MAENLLNSWACLSNSNVVTCGRAGDKIKKREAGLFVLQGANL